MSDIPSPVSPIRPGLPAAPQPTAPYTDRQAMNDIHALLTTPSPLPAAGALEAIAQITARTGRPPGRSRIITAGVADDQLGMPVARVEADGTVVLVSQDPHGPGLLISITPRDAADEDALVITVGGTIISPSPAPAGDVSSPAGTGRHPATITRSYRTGIQGKDTGRDRH